MRTEHPLAQRKTENRSDSPAVTAGIAPVSFIEVEGYGIRPEASLRIVLVSILFEYFFDGFDHFVELFGVV